MRCFAFLLLWCSFSLAQAGSVDGYCRDAAGGQPLAGVLVRCSGGLQSAVADASGRFVFSCVQDSLVVEASLLGYTAERTVVACGASAFAITLKPTPRLVDEVTITATRTNPRVAMGTTTLTRMDLLPMNLGQDLPMMLSQTPSVVTYSDAGAGIGYTWLRIRGTDPTRLNTTINGIPVNDAESHTTYFVNIPDLASSAQSMEIQRGVGTSTNGSASFGGSLNLHTLQYTPSAYAQAVASGGSFGTLRNTLAFGTGLLGNGFTLDGRLSRIQSNGFIDRASANLQAAYGCASWYGTSSSVRLVAFTGQEVTYQAWNGVPEAKYNNDTAGVRAYINRNGWYLNAMDKNLLLNSRPTRYNGFYYENQIDRYRQDYYQMHVSHRFSRRLDVHAALHYTKGGGYYEEYRPSETLALYGLQDVVQGKDTLRAANLIRRKWLDNDFYGATFSLNLRPSGRWLHTWGGGLNRYDGRHFGRVIWSELALGGWPTRDYYNNRAQKTDGNLYWKSTVDLSSDWLLLMDAQVRAIGYSFYGFGDDRVQSQQWVQYRFFNPKASLTRNLGANGTLTGSFGQAMREPTRVDLVNSTPASRPSPEVLRDYELCWKANYRLWKMGITAYFMDYYNQLVLTGKINDVGAYQRTNVARSYRAGIEWEAAWRILPTLTLEGNLTLSQNRVLAFTEYLDDYDAGGQREVVHSQTPLAFSPALVGAGSLVWEPLKGLRLTSFHKYVGRQYLDNTGSIQRSLSDFYTTDVRIGYTLSTRWIPEVAVHATVYNLLNRRYAPNGYTFGYWSGGQRVSENFVYPQACAHVLAGVTLTFR